MEIVIAVAAFAASMLTLFSGFGLGTILTPVFGLFFPLPLAVALTGIVHLLNNFFKLALLGKNASKPMVLRFGLPSVVGGFVGATALAYLSSLPVLFEWECCGRAMQVSLLKICIASLMVAFALMEMVPWLKKLNISSKYMTYGGLLSGFFGGLSGHQGALRSAFLVNSGLSKEAFVATGVVIACMVDTIRLPVYFSRLAEETIVEKWPLLLLATLCAFAGAYLGTRYLKKTTLGAVQKLTAIMILVIALLLATGIV